MKPHTSGLARPGVAVLMSVRAVILPLSQVSALVCIPSTNRALARPRASSTNNLCTRERTIDLA